jgi:hypothetical protein
MYYLSPFSSPLCSNVSPLKGIDTSLLFFTDLYRLCGNVQMETEGYQLHESFTQSLLNDHFQSTQQAEHKLIQVSNQSFKSLYY